MCWRRENAGSPSTLEARGPGAERTAVVLPSDAGAWLTTTLEYLLAEVAAGQPGCRAMLTRLVELLYVDVLRRYARFLPVGQAGWLAGLNDLQVGRALRLLHRDPARAWTVETVARAAGASRSSLALRFTELIGESPMHYLTGWRMHLARRLLQDDRLTIPEVAAQVGYSSESAFNRAFKRATGTPPRLWLRREVSRL